MTKNSTCSCLVLALSLRTLATAKKNKKDGVAATSSHFSSCYRLDGLTDHLEGFVVCE